MDAESRPTSQAPNLMVHQLVSLVGVSLGAVTAVYFSSWAALAIFALSVWIAPQPRTIAGLATAATLSIAICMFMGHLPLIADELLGLGNATLFSWASALLRVKVDLSPIATVSGLQQLSALSPVPHILVDSEQRIVHSTGACDTLFLEDDGASLTGLRLYDVLHCPALREYLDAPNEEGFTKRPMKVRSLRSDNTFHLGIDVQPIDYREQVFTFLSFTKRDPEVRTAQVMREKITELHANVAAVSDLVIAIGPDGAIRSHNTNARQILPELASADSGKQKITDILKSVGEESFKTAFREASQAKDRRSKPMTLVSRSSTDAVSLRGCLHRFPGSKSATLIATNISQEIALKKELTRQKSQNQQLLNASPTALLVIAKNSGRIIEVNRTSQEQFGYSANELVDASLFECGLLTNEFEARLLREHLKNSAERVEGEFTLSTKQGKTIRAEYSLRNGKLAGHDAYFMHVRDITRKHRSQMALRESEEKFSRIFTESPDGIAIVDLETLDVIDVNKQFIERGDYEHDDVIGEQLHCFVADPSDLEAAMSDVVKSGHLNNLNLDFINKQGQLLVSLTSISTVDLNGKPSLLFIVKDIQQQREAEAKLRSSEQRFRGTFENAPLGMMLADTSGRIFQANRFAADLLAYAGEDLPGTHLSRLVPASDRTRLLERLEKLISGEIPLSHSERRLVAQTGLEIWVNFRVVVQRNDEGNPLYFIIQMADISETKRSQDRMERLAFYDTLTNLANRRLYNDRLQQAINNSQRNQRSAALMYLDLDQFKRVNDTLGHDAGDSLLKHVASRLQKCVRSHDTVSRPGGDEFTIILDGIDNVSEASRVAENILEELRKPVSIAGQQLVVTTSIGISLMPQDSLDAQTLMRNADMAMYKAKERGRNNYQFFTTDMNENAVNRLRIETELRTALDNNEFELYYQPKVRLTDHALIGVECLIRWNHPQRGLLGPMEFISIAEESGVIVNIGSWVIEQACIAGKILQEESTLPFQIALNMSPRQFRDPTLINTVRRCLRESSLPPELLELEITETMLMHDIKAASLTVQHLFDLGVQLAIDDFGTGYSSLNYLKRFPINTIKVDRSFVMDIPSSEDDMAITSAVIAMAHRLKMSVVAEGVETVKQLKFLKEQNCEYAQGYLFGKPMPLDAIRRLIASDNERLVS